MIPFNSCLNSLRLHPLFANASNEGSEKPAPLLLPDTIRTSTRTLAHIVITDSHVNSQTMVHSTCIDPIDIC